MSISLSANFNPAAAGAPRMGESVEQLLRRAQTLRDRAGEIADEVRADGEQPATIQALETALRELFRVQDEFRGVQDLMHDAGALSEANRASMSGHVSSIDGYVMLVSGMLIDRRSSLYPTHELRETVSDVRCIRQWRCRADGTIVERSPRYEIFYSTLPAALPVPTPAPAPSAVITAAAAAAAAAPMLSPTPPTTAVTPALAWLIAPL